MKSHWEIGKRLLGCRKGACRKNDRQCLQAARISALVAGVAVLGIFPIALAAQAGADLLVAGGYEGTPSLTLSNGTLDLTFLPQGASMASVILRDGEKLNPLWNPVRMNRELGRKADPSPMTGHILCIDGFGPPSPEERQAGVPFNGEAHNQTFEAHSSKTGSTAEVTLTAKLPIVQEAVTRTIRMVDGENVVYVETQLENLLAFDRPINWGEHATVGSPFLEPGVTVFDLSGERSRTTPYKELTTPMDPTSQRRLASDQEFSWPSAPSRDGKTADMRQTPENPHYVDHVATLMDTSRQLEWATALNPKEKLILGYVFRREDFPWVQTWGNYPPSMKLARGMEFATQPFSASRRDAVTEGSMFGIPTYRWLPAKSKITTRFLMFYARVPEGFTKVDDVRVENGQIVIEDHTTHQQVRLKCSLQIG
jgi:hypothetical protein